MAYHGIRKQKSHSCKAKDEAVTIPAQTDSHLHFVSVSLAEPKKHHKENSVEEVGL